MNFKGKLEKELIAIGLDDTKLKVNRFGINSEVPYSLNKILVDNFFISMVVHTLNIPNK